jgi:mRNA interferase HigB
MDIFLWLPMRIIARRTLLEFAARRADQKDHGALVNALNAWFNEVRKAHWSNTAEVRTTFATASIVGSDRLVFNIKGNDYRLVVAVDYFRSIVWIKWIGTHAAYDRIDVRTVQHGD